MDCGAGAGALSMALDAQLGVHGPAAAMHHQQMMMEAEEGHVAAMEAALMNGADPAWAAQFATAGPMMMAHHMDPMAMGGDWSGQFHQEQHHPAAVEAAIAHAEAAFASAAEATAAADLETAFAAAMAQADTDEDWAAAMEAGEGEAEAWAEDYNNPDVKTFGAEGEPLKTYEEKVEDSAFYDFMRKVRNGEVVVEDGDADAAAAAKAATEDGGFINEFANATPATAQVDSDTEDVTDFDAQYNQLWQQHAAGGDQQDGAHLDEAWDEAEELDEYGAEYLGREPGAGELDGEQWAQEYDEMLGQARRAQDSSVYPFDPNNPYLFHDNPFEEGLQLLAAGTLSDAVLAFEAACQKTPDRAEAWRLLGTTQAENEKDVFAIRALTQAKQLDPKCRAVHLALAVSHTNEANHTQALHALRDWIRSDGQYEAIAGFVEGMGSQNLGEPSEDFAAEFLFVSPTEHREVCGLFEAAIHMNPTDVDLHIGLGILRNLSHEYDLAAKSFEEALKLRPDDAKLWNKLGATLANGSRSREAIAAYERALDINPGYVRAQYNLGISHSNLGDHAAAARQFLRAIVMQQGGVVQPGDPDSGNPNKYQRSTRELWDVLRMTLNLMERPDLVSLTWKSDVAPFLSEFGLTDLI